MDDNDLIFQARIKILVFFPSPTKVLDTVKLDPC